MSGELRPYDPQDVLWVLALAGGGGAIDMTEGLIDGPGAVTETKDAPPWTRRGDRQGNMVRVKSSKRGGAVTFTYAAEAQLQDELTAVVQLDQLSENQVGTLTCRDLNGTTLIEYVGAFVENDPDVNYGDTAADRVYVIGYAERKAFIGGAAAL